MGKKMNLDKEAQQNQSQEQIQNEIRLNYDEQQNSRNEEFEQIDDQDELKQEVAFHFDIDEPEATEEEKLAYQYMQFVKNQKKKLKQDRKKLVYPTQQIHQSNQNQLQKQHSLYFKQKENSKPSWFEQFQQQLYTHWSCIVQNIKYLIQKNTDYQQNERKKNKKMYQALTLKQVPMIYELTNLTIGQIQQLMVKFSKQIHQILDQDNQIVSSSDDSIKNYNLWMYSLLALHQSWANYKHFQQIRQVNSVIEQLFTKKLLSNNQGSILTTLVLLLKHFQQKHLQKFMKIYLQKQQNQRQSL